MYIIYCIFISYEYTYIFFGKCKMFVLYAITIHAVKYGCPQLQATNRSTATHPLKKCRT